MKYFISLSIFLLLCLACKQNPSNASDIPDGKNNAIQKKVAETNGGNQYTNSLIEHQDQEAKMESESSTASKDAKAVIDKNKVVALEKNKIKTESTKPISKPTSKPVKEINVEKKAPTKIDAQLEEKSKVLVKEQTAAEKTLDEIKVKPPVEKLATKPALNHDAFNTLLTTYVSSTGKVNYKGLKEEESKLDSYLKLLAENAPNKDWPEDKALAYWINLYNAGTIKLVLNNYPVGSIKDIAGGKPWDKVWIKSGSKTLSLNNIENDIIRPTFNEPRIHFAVNCAAKSCPSLLNKAFTAENLNKLLKQQTVKFINNSTFNMISSDQAKVSKIFDWYGKDFGNLRSFLNKYANTKIAEGTSIAFMEYDWSLNE